METHINFYAIFQDGSNSPIHSLESIKVIPGYSFILKITTIGSAPSYLESETYEFVDSSGELANLKMGDWELLHISKTKYNSRRTRYTLYNHKTQSAFEFTGDKLALEFVKHTLLPKLQELNNIKDYEKYLLNQRIDKLELDLAILKENYDAIRKNEHQ